MVDLQEHRAAASAAAVSPAMHIVDLTKHYGRIEALTGLSMTVPRGEVFGFLGPNGAGKTTAIKLLLGLAAPTSGEAWVLGERAGTLAARRRVGYLPELFRYQPWLTAREVLALHCELIRLPRSGWTAEIDGALRLVGLDGRETERVRGYSKGMQQRLGLGVALLGAPELILLDEPTSALDPVGRHDVRELIHELKARGKAVFLNSHLLTEVEMVCDRVAMVDQGHVIATGTLDDLLGGGSCRFRIGGLAPEARHALGRFGALNDDGTWLTITGLDADRVPEVVSTIVEQGGRLYAVEPRHQSLEDRFLELLQAPRDG